jgi:hypothetical protein
MQSELFGRVLQIQQASDGKSAADERLVLSRSAFTQLTV